MIVAVYGSSRQGGNTDILMDTFLQQLSVNEEIIRYRLRDLDLRPCNACGRCHKTGKCIFNDDIWGIYSTLNKARGLVLSSPIYFASVSAILKIFIDRGQAFWANKYLLNNENLPLTKKGFFISAGGMDTDKYFLNARMVIKTFMKTLDIDYSGDLFVSGVDGRGEIRGRDKSLEEARLKGKEF